MTAADAGWTLVALGTAHVFYTYIGYPLVMAALPARPPRVAAGSQPGRVSIIIAARDPGRAVAAKVAGLLSAVAIDCEVIVVLDGPDAQASDALSAISDERFRVLVLPHPEGKAAALNRAVAMARGDVLVFSDVRQRIVFGAVERLVAALGSPDVGAVSGALEIAPHPGGRRLLDLYWRMERWLRWREAAWDSTVGVTGAFYALKRELWRPLPKGLLLDDVWVPFLVVYAGQRVGFEPSAIAMDVRLGTDGTELARKVRTLSGNYQLVAWKPTLLDPRANRLWWQFVSHKILRLATPLALAMAFVGLLLLSGRWAGAVATVLSAVVALVWFVPPATPGVRGARPLHLLRSGLVMQAACLMAALNAIRGRWDIWSDPVRSTFPDAPSP